jgi:hypothetical protein
VASTDDVRHGLSAARRAKTIAAVLEAFAWLGTMGAIAGGIGMTQYRETDAYSELFTRPLVVAGLCVAVGGLLVGLSLVTICAYIQARAAATLVELQAPSTGWIAPGPT